MPAAQPAPYPQGCDSFLERMRPRLLGMLRSYRIPLADAEDLLQQALLALLYRWDTVRYPERWLFGVVKKKCLMYWRRYGRRLTEAVDDSTLEWLAEPLPPPQEHGDLSRDLSHVASRLPPRYRSLLRLRFALGLESAEIAARLGYRPSSIGKVTSRSLSAFGSELREAGWPQEHDGSMRH